MTRLKILISVPLTQDQRSAVLKLQSSVLFNGLKSCGHEVELDERGAVPPSSYDVVIYMGAAPSDLPSATVTIIGQPSPRRVAWCLDWRDYTYEIEARHNVLERYAYGELDENACAHELMAIEPHSSPPKKKSSLKEILQGGQFDEVWVSTDLEADLLRLEAKNISVTTVGLWTEEVTPSKATMEERNLITLVGPVTATSGHFEVLAAFAGAGFPICVLHPGTELPPQLEEGLKRFPNITSLKCVSAADPAMAAEALAKSRLVVSLDPSNLPVPWLANACASGCPVVIIAGGSFDCLSRSAFLAVQVADWRGLLQLGSLPLSSWKVERPQFASSQSLIARADIALRAASAKQPLSITPPLITSSLFATSAANVPPQRPEILGSIASVRDFVRQYDQQPKSGSYYRELMRRISLLGNAISQVALDESPKKELINLITLLAERKHHSALRALLIPYAREAAADAAVLFRGIELLAVSADVIAARTMLDQILRQNPRSSLALNFAGSLALGIGRPKQAQANFELLIADKSSDSDGWAGLGCARLQQQDIAGAHHAFLQALAINPSHPLASQGARAITPNAPGSQLS